MKPLRCAVLGLGVGMQHAQAIARHARCELAAVCDIDREVLARARIAFRSVSCTTDAAAVLDDPEIDLVSIATYDDAHAAQVERAIQRGKHVFVEKPLCQRPDEARRIRAALREHPEVRLSSNLILRRSPRMIELRRMIAAGTLGRLFHVEGDYLYGRLHKITDGWRGRLDCYSVVLGGAVHVVDLLLWLTGDRVVEVAAFGNRIASTGSRFRFNDMAVAILRFASGMTGKVSANFGCVLPHSYGLAIYGTDATFVNGVSEAALFDSRDPNARPRLITTAHPGAGKGELLSSFVESILEGAPHDPSEDDVFRTMSVCLAIERAMTEGVGVSVEDL